ncbi:MAG: glycosyl transferase family 2, partial [Beggiatoa sp. IS2]
REVPTFEVHEYQPKHSDFCVGIPILNEGERIHQQLDRMIFLKNIADIIIADGGSTDGSTAQTALQEKSVRTLLVKTGPGKLSAQLRMLFSYALDQGYLVITLDGNNKDGVEAIPEFITALQQDYAYVQGSRYLSGGMEINTPFIRKLAVKWLHAPLISFAARFPYTDTTNGFRAFSREFLLDERVQLFRAVFDAYNLHFYLSIRAPRLGYKVKEIPVIRAYPAQGPIPSKIGGLKGNFALLKQLLWAVAGFYNPK